MKGSRKLIFGALALVPLASVARKEAKPNIIFILCDDMGYGDLACYGQPYISTPCLDRMAEEGMRFTQAYSGSPISAPSRAALMTGQHSGHAEVRDNREYWSGEVYYGQNKEYAVTGQHPYAADHVILPEIMKDNGYTTGMFGKWAGGYEGSPSTPDKRGIDEYYGYICQFQAHAYYPNFLNAYSRAAGDTCVRREVLEENIKYPMYGPEYKKRPQYSADLIHRRAMQWLAEQDGKQPFFGIFTYTLPHAELAQPEDSILRAYEARFHPDKNYGGDEASRYHPVTRTHAHFAAMITRLDTYVGEIMTLVRWPGRIKAGTVNDHQLAFYDVMPTLCELAGVKRYDKRYANGKPDDWFDGLSFYPTLMGKKQKQHDFLYWELAQTNQIGLRMGDWKMVVRRGKPELYNLATDLHEDHNVADKHPDIVRRMVEKIHAEHTPSPYFKVTLPQLPE